MYFEKRDRLILLIDAADHALVSEYSWHGDKGSSSYYAIAKSCNKHIRLHRLLLPGVKLIDHINRNGMDNRRCNIRAATRSENGHNQKLHKNNKSGRNGVHDDHKRKRIVVQWKVNYKIFANFFYYESPRLKRTKQEAMDLACARRDAVDEMINSKNGEDVSGGVQTEAS